jgi:hypothetical protein
VHHGLAPDNVDTLRPHAVGNERGAVPRDVDPKPGHGVQDNAARAPGHVRGEQPPRDSGEAEHAGEDGVGVLGLGVVVGRRLLLLDGVRRGAIGPTKVEDAAERVRRGREDGEREVRGEHGHQRLAELPETPSAAAVMNRSRRQRRESCGDVIVRRWRGRGGGNEHEDEKEEGKGEGCGGKEVAPQQVRLWHEREEPSPAPRRCHRVHVTRSGFRKYEQRKPLLKLKSL